MNDANNPNDEHGAKCIKRMSAVFIYIETDDDDDDEKELNLILYPLFLSHDELPIWEMPPTYVYVFSSLQPFNVFKDPTGNSYMALIWKWVWIIFSLNVDVTLGERLVNRKCFSFIRRQVKRNAIR